jgi:hypothetical protein
MSAWNWLPDKIRPSLHRIQPTAHVYLSNIKKIKKAIIKNKKKIG